MKKSHLFPTGSQLSAVFLWFLITCGRGAKTGQSPQSHRQQTIYNILLSGCSLTALSPCCRTGCGTGHSYPCMYTYPYADAGYFTVQTAVAYCGGTVASRQEVLASVPRWNLPVLLESVWVSWFTSITTSFEYVKADQQKLPVCSCVTGGSMT